MALCATAVACSPACGADLPPGVTQIGTLAAPSLSESSGLAVCSTAPGVFWTHNDGKRPILYAFERDGRNRGAVAVSGTKFSDWEDLASDGKGHLYLGDIGNNDLERDTLAVHEIAEPDPAALPSRVAVQRSWKLQFPKNPFNAEGLFVWQGNGYVVSKVFNDAKAGLYRFPLSTTTEPVVLQRIAKLHVDSPVTGAALSADGNRLALVSKTGAALLDFGGKFEALSETKPFWVKFRHEHIEGCAFVQEGLMATAESREIYLFTAPEFRTPAPAKPTPPPEAPAVK